MKKFLTSVAVLTMFASFASAGSLVEPEMEAPVEVVQEDTGSSGGLLIPLLVLVAIGALIANSD